MLQKLGHLNMYYDKPSKQWHLAFGTSYTNKVDYLVAEIASLTLLRSRTNYNPLHGLLTITTTGGEVFDFCMNLPYDETVNKLVKRGVAFKKTYTNDKLVCEVRIDPDTELRYWFLDSIRMDEAINPTKLAPSVSCSL